MRFTISKQILVTCTMIIAIFVMLDLYMYHRMTTIQETYQTLLSESTDFTSTAKDIRTQLWMRNTYVRNYILTGDSTYITKSNDMKALTETKLSFLADTMQSPQAAKEIGILKLALTEYDKTLDQGAAVREKLGIDGTLKFLAATGKRADGMETIIDDFTEFVSSQIKSEIEQTQKEQAHSMIILLVCNLLTLAFAVWAAFFLSRRISQPVAKMAETAANVAQGDLRATEKVYGGNNEIGDMAKSMEGMVGNLRHIVKQIVDTGKSVASASDQLNLVSEQSAQAAQEIASTTTHLAEGAVTQTDEMNQVVGIVANMVSHIGEVAKNTETLAQRASKTADIANEGKTAVTKASAQMQRITESVSQSADGVKALGQSSAQIGNIVQVISDIASQTNLLALNAAIEAARAGEHGRGFAVVAGEVKKLADQSQSAAQSITDLIIQIQTHIQSVVEMMETGNTNVAAGTEEMNSTLEQFNHIAALIEDLNHQVLDITHATEKVSQSGNTVLGSIDKVKAMVEKSVSGTHSISAATQQQLASTEEISSSSSILAKQAKELESMMSHFKL